MCGIIGATGGDNVLDLLLEGLERLEYRGYDSAGVALQADGADGTLWRARAATGTRSLERPGQGGGGRPRRRGGRHRPHPLGHPRAPHRDQRPPPRRLHGTGGRGPQRHHRELARADRPGSRPTGTCFASDTDTEVVAHLVEEELAGGASLADAVRTTVRELRGAFALAVVCAGEPGTIVAARRVSPLVVGARRRR